MPSDTLVTSALLPEAFADPSLEATIVERVTARPSALTELNVSTGVTVRVVEPERRVTAPSDGAMSWIPPGLRPRPIAGPLEISRNLTVASQATQVGDLVGRERPAACADGEVLTAHLPVPMDVDDLPAEERPRAASLRSPSLPSRIHVRDLIERGTAPDPRHPAAFPRRSASGVVEPGELSSPLVVPLVDFSEDDLVGPVSSGRASHWNVPVAPSCLRSFAPPERVERPASKALRSSRIAEAATTTFHYDALPEPARPRAPVARLLDDRGEVKPQRFIRTQVISPPSLALAPEPTQATGLARFAQTVLLDFDALTKPPALVAPFVFLGLGLAFLLIAAVHVL